MQIKSDGQRSPKTAQRLFKRRARFAKVYDLSTNRCFRLRFNTKNPGPRFFIPKVKNYFSPQFRWLEGVSSIKLTGLS
jgi:hypothetical protein